MGPNAFLSANQQHQTNVTENTEWNVTQIPAVTLAATE